MKDLKIVVYSKVNKVPPISPMITATPKPPDTSDKMLLFRLAFQHFSIVEGLLYKKIMNCGNFTTSKSVLGGHVEILKRASIAAAICVLAT